MENYKTIAQELKKAYSDIFTWWSTEAFNKTANQYYGFIDHFGKKDANAPLGIIMYSRILWSFSAASLFFKNADYLSVARQTKAFLENHFYDKTNGGYLWEITTQRQALITKKQTYAQAFVLYGLCEYYAASHDEKALADALELFDLMEIHCFDKEFGGYFEAYTQEWTQLEDVRLSPIDQNNPKSMNTNLHVLEAYTRLLSITGNERVKTALTNLAEVFYKYIIDKDGHLQLFFDKNWNSQVREHSYGHDIETSWLLWDAIETIGNESMKEKYKPLILKMADVFLAEALDEKKESCIYHRYLDTNKYNTERHWWVLCEALEGLGNAFELTHDEKYRSPIVPFWNYISEHIIDRTNGEWHWGVDENKKPLQLQPKLSNWKAPYHNSRALMRLIEKMDKW